VESSTSRITERSRLISGHAEKVSAVSAEALDGMSEIDAGTSEISSAMQELNRAVAKLSDTIGEIGRNVEQFKTQDSVAGQEAPGAVTTNAQPGHELDHEQEVEEEEEDGVRLALDSTEEADDTRTHL
jgi:DNA anti-recombination protein RmuC